MAGLGLAMAASVRDADAQLPQRSHSANPSHHESQYNSNTSWAHEVISDARQNANGIHSEQQLHFFIAQHVKVFTDQIGMLGVENEESHHYSQQDYQDLLLQATQLQEVLNGIANKLGIELEHSNLHYIISQLEKKSGTVYFQEKKLLDQDPQH